MTNLYARRPMVTRNGTRKRKKDWAFLAVFCQGSSPLCSGSGPVEALADACWVRLRGWLLLDGPGWDSGGATPLGRVTGSPCSGTGVDLKSDMVFRELCADPREPGTMYTGGGHGVVSLRQLRGSGLEDPELVKGLPPSPSSASQP